jgi:Tol biopolymer transport system component
VANSEEFCAIGIAWKPDSRVIAFWNAPGDQAINRTIWVINRDGTGRKVIHSFEQWVEWGDPAWSPDGQQIVFWYEAGGQGQGLLINADGRGAPEVINSYEEMPWPWFPWNWPPAYQSPF